MILTALAPQRVMTMPALLPAPIPAMHEGDEGAEAEADDLAAARVGSHVPRSQSARYEQSAMKVRWTSGRQQT